MTGIEIPVTPKVAAELAAAARMIEGSEGLKERRKLTDQGSYSDLAHHLEALTVAVLGAVSAAPMTGPQKAGARFSLNADRMLNGQLIESAAYLRDTARELLAAGELDRWKSEHAEVALGLLKKLNGLILSEIVRQAEADLEAVRSRGINALMPAAEALAKAAVRAPAPVALPDEPATVRPRIERD